MKFISLPSVEKAIQSGCSSASLDVWEDYIQIFKKEKRYAKSILQCVEFYRPNDIRVRLNKIMAKIDSSYNQLEPSIRELQAFLLGKEDLSKDNISKIKYSLVKAYSKQKEYKKAEPLVNQVIEYFVENHPSEEITARFLMMSVDVYSETQNQEKLEEVYNNHFTHLVENNNEYEYLVRVAAQINQPLTDNPEEQVENLVRLITFLEAKKEYYIALVTQKRLITLYTELKDDERFLESYLKFVDMLNIYRSPEIDALILELGDENIQYLLSLDQPESAREFIRKAYEPLLIQNKYYNAVLVSNGYLFYYLSDENKAITYSDFGKFEQSNGSVNQ